MTPERWRQVTAIFHAARENDPARRPSLLDRMCGEDASLRAEVESLLAAHAEASRAGRAGVSIDLLPQLSPGTSFGQYRVEALIGAGGMGQVYRATDMRLQRAVAIKVLPPEFANDRDFDARFEREARVLASLSHPNIAAIHGLEEASGVKGLVLEFIEGPTLAEMLSGTGHSALGTGKALTIANQIALALEAAHEKGIIHRDLKPANIKITPAGVVKVLDFGIARVVEPIAGRTGLRSAPNADHSSVRATYSDTATGLILGTPAYMSPEQARGLPLDKRADIWAFGCVLYEMLTGRGAFAAETASDSLAKIIEREPDWNALPARVPAPIRRLIARCLQKDPADRLRDIADARFEIAEALAAPAHVGEVAAPPARVTPGTRVLIGVAGTFIVAVMIWAVWRTLTLPDATPASGPRMEFGVTFPNNVIPAQGVAVSPDGRHIAVGTFTNSAQIWVHSLQQSETRLLSADGGASPFWSPDSASIGFFRAGMLWTSSLAGGVARSIAPAVRGFGGTWNNAGVILFAADNKLFQMSAAGGTPAEVRLQGVTRQAGFPQFLPDGRHFVFMDGRRGGEGTMRLASLDSDRTTTLVESDGVGAFAPPDHLLFVRNTSLMAQKIDLTRLVLDGEPQVVASGVSRGSLGDVMVVVVSASANGTIALPAPRGGSRGQLTWFDRNGKPSRAIEPPPSEVEYLNPVLSPDGTLVAANRMNPETGRWDIWSIDLARNLPSKLTVGADSEFDPVWSPDGREVAFMSDKGGRVSLYRQPIAGGAAALLLELGDAAIASPTDWSRDGRYLLYQKLESPFWSMWALPLVGDRTPIRVIGGEAGGYGGHLSPDGQWLAYSGFESNQFQIFVRRFLGDAPKKQISHGGGVHPRWTRDGKEIVYWTPPGGIFANDISISGSDIRVGPTRTLVDRPVLSLIDSRPHYDVTRDGERLLVRQPAGPPGAGIRVIVNWMSKTK